MAADAVELPEFASQTVLLDLVNGQVFRLADAQTCTGQSGGMTPPIAYRKVGCKITAADEEKSKR